MKVLRRLVGKNIKQIRLKLNLTQEKAAERTGFHYKYYQKIESGNVNLTLDSIENISNAFRVKVKNVIGN